MNLLPRRIRSLLEKAKLRYFLKTYSSTMFEIAFSLLKNESLAEQAVFLAFSNIIPCLYKISRRNFAKTQELLSIATKYAALSLQNNKTNENADTTSADPVLWSNYQFHPVATVAPCNSSDNSLSSRLLPLLSNLRPLEQDLLFLLYLHGLTLEEAATLLKLPPATAKSCFLQVKEYLITSSASDDSKLLHL